MTAPQNKHADEWETPRTDIGGLYRQYGRPVYHYLLALTGCVTDAEEYLQRVFVKAVRQPAGFLQAEHQKAYLLRSARNEVWLEARSKHTRKEFVPEEAELLLLPSRELPANERMEKRERAVEIQLALFSLSMPQRETIQLHVFEEMTFSEMAIVTGEPVSTLSNRYQASLQKLREVLHEYRSE